MKKRWFIAMLCALFMVIGFQGNAKAAVKVEKLSVTTKSKKGFDPKKDKSVTIQVKVKTDQKNSDVRIRVLNTKGKYVYQKTVKNQKKQNTITVKWNGKATKGNAAKVKENSYVKNGNYTVEVYVSYKNAKKKTITAKKTTKLKVYTPPQKNPVKPTPEVKGAKPIYTGDAEIDYLAELMVKEAGVKSSMTQDQKVKAIYHWMTYNFYHVHADEPLGKHFYNLDKLKSQVASYKKKTDKEVADKKAIYSHYSFYKMHERMQYRCGECNTTSAAFKLLCNHVGVESGICHGYYINRSGKKSNHYWNYAVIDGKTYYYDIDVQIQNVGKVSKELEYYWYKETRAESEQRHEFLD